MTSRYIAIDWGSTNLRARLYRVSSARNAGNQKQV